MVPQDENGVSSTVLIDRDACMGSGNCVYWAPDVFDIDDEGVAVVVGDAMSNEELVRLASKNCPTGAILVDTFYR